LPTVSKLVSEGLATENEASDAWGHRLILSTDAGGKLIAPGRDGIEGTTDDFVMYLGGGAALIPPPMSQADAAILAQEGKEQP
jgi:hypothetical protein